MVETLQESHLEPSTIIAVQECQEGAANNQGKQASTQEQEQEPKQQQDPLATALRSLFVHVTTLVQSQLQGNNTVLELLEKMNLRTADEYNEFGDFAAGLRVFVERLKLKNDSVQQYVEQIDEIEQELSELEAVVSTLNTHTVALEAKLRAAYNEQQIN